MTRIRNTEGVYIHIAGKLDRSPSPAAAPATEGLRTMLSDLREPLTGLSDTPAVISANLFRAAWLHQLGPAAVLEHHDPRLGHYDVAILVRLANPHSVSDLLDHDAMRQLLSVLHTHGRDVVITPARNIGATARGPAHGALSLIRHVLAPEAADGDTSLSDAAWPAREPALVERRSSFRPVRPPRRYDRSSGPSWRRPTRENL